MPLKNMVALSPWSGDIASCFFTHFPRFFRHRRRFGKFPRRGSLKCEAQIPQLSVKSEIRKTFFRSSSAEKLPVKQKNVGRRLRLTVFIYLIGNFSVSYQIKQS